MWFSLMPLDCIKARSRASNPAMKLRRLLLLGFGWFCVGLGGLGIILPILPTTPFLLVAVWAFSKSSPELAEKIRNHPRFGPLVRDWQDHGVIPPYAKALAIVMMSVMSGYLLFYSDAPKWVALAASLTMLAVAAYILTRPSRRKP
jgi:uncharacterized protein